MQTSATISMAGALKAIKAASLRPREIKRALTIAAIGQVRDIKDRTSKGKGLKSPFKPYSSEYNIFKAKRKGGSPTVNLVFSGRMLGDLGVVKANHNEAVISFHRASERKKAESNQKSRPFMGITDKEQKVILKRFKRALFK